MLTLDFKVSGRRRSFLDDNEPRYMRHHTWVAVGIGGAGLIANLYGANKQSKDNKAANAENKALQDEQNRMAWANYLMTRGLNPSGAAPGVIPQNAQRVNTRLPLWANVQRTQAPAGFRIRGTGARLAPGAPAGASTAAAAAVPNQETNSGALGQLEPKNQWKRALDPIGLFG